MEPTFTVILVDIYGHRMRRDGTFVSGGVAGEKGFEATFSDLESARDFCRELLREMPHVECGVFNSQGQMVFEHHDEAWRTRQEELQTLAFAKQKRQDRLVLASLTGLLMLIVALASFYLLRRS